MVVVWYHCLDCGRMYSKVITPNQNNNKCPYCHTSDNIVRYRPKVP